MSHRVRASLLVLTMLTVAVAATACGGGSGGGAADGVGMGSPSTSLAATFTPEDPSPAPGSVALAAGTAGSGDQVDVIVDAVGVNGVYGASFDVVYDPARLAFVNWSAGSALEAGGTQVIYQVSAVDPGRVVVGIARAGGAAVDIVGARPLVHLAFRARQPGSHALTFQAATLLDGQAPPRDIGEIAWFGGTVTAN